MNGETCHSCLKRRKPSFVPRSSFLVPRSSPGFTIVELLMVIGIISVLITITASAVSDSLQRARTQKASAICTLVEQGLATYYAQKDEWPWKQLEDKEPNADANGDKNAKNKTVYLLEEDQVQTMVRNMLQEMKGSSPLVVMDVSGLFVAQGDSKYGMDFLDAVRGTKKNPEGIPFAQMVFGYPDPSTGKFKRFKMTYSPDADKVTVSQQ